MRQAAGPGGQLRRPVGIILEVFVLMPLDETVRQALAQFEHMAHDMAGDPFQAGFELVFFLHFGDGPAIGIRLGKERVVDAAGGQVTQQRGRHEFRIGRQGKGARPVVPRVSIDQPMPANCFGRSG